MYVMYSVTQKMLMSYRLLQEPFTRTIKAWGKPEKFEWSSLNLSQIYFYFSLSLPTVLRVRCTMIYTLPCLASVQYFKDLLTSPFSESITVTLNTECLGTIILVPLYRCAVPVIYRCPAAITITAAVATTDRRPRGSYCPLPVPVNLPP